MATVERPKVVQGAERFEPIIDKSDRYHPLGAKVRIMPYRIPDRFKDDAELIVHLRKVREDIEQQGGDFLKTVEETLFKDIGLNAANAKRFRKNKSAGEADLPRWVEFQKTYEVITAKLLGLNGGWDLKNTGRERAANFLRPLAYHLIPEEDGSEAKYIWSYLPLSRIVPPQMPEHCAFKLIEIDAENVLDELRLDLKESFDRRENPYPSYLAANQCAEPRHPVGVVTGVGIEGAGDVGEGEDIPLTANETAELVADTEDVSYAQDLPREGGWELTEFTCGPPTLEDLGGGKAVFRAPPQIAGDCMATVRRTMTPSQGPVRSVEKEIQIYNTKNNAPEVSVRGPNVSEPGLPITLKAIGSDKDGDALTYKWEQVTDVPIRIISQEGNKITFQAVGSVSKKTDVMFRVTVTDNPNGARATPLSSEATHTVRINPNWQALDGTLIRDKRRKELAKFAESTGGTARPVTSGELIDAIAKASTPDGLVDGLDLVYVLDTSSSMVDDIEKIRAEIPRILGEAITKVKGGIKSIRVAIVSYADNKTVYHLDLTNVGEDELMKIISDGVPKDRDEIRYISERNKINTIPERDKINTISKDKKIINNYAGNEFQFKEIPKSECSTKAGTLLQKKLCEVIDRTLNVGGGLETIWDTLFKTIKHERWREGENYARKIVYITDERGDIGDDHHTKPQAYSFARSRDIVVNDIFILSEDEKRFKIFKANLLKFSDKVKKAGSDDERVGIFESEFPAISNEIGKTEFGLFGINIAKEFATLFGYIEAPEKRVKLAGKFFNSDIVRRYWPEVYGRILLGHPDGARLFNEYVDGKMKEKDDASFQDAKSVFDFVNGLSDIYDKGYQPILSERAGARLLPPTVFADKILFPSFARMVVDPKYEPSFGLAGIAAEPEINNIYPDYERVNLPYILHSMFQDAGLRLEITRRNLLPLIKSGNKNAWVSASAVYYRVVANMEGGDHPAQTRQFLDDIRGGLKDPNDIFSSGYRIASEIFYSALSVARRWKDKNEAAKIIREYAVPIMEAFKKKRLAAAGKPPDEDFENYYHQAYINLEITSYSGVGTAFRKELEGYLKKYFGDKVSFYRPAASL